MDPKNFVLDEYGSKMLHNIKASFQNTLREPKMRTSKQVIVTFHRSIKCSLFDIPELHYYHPVCLLNHTETMFRRETRIFNEISDQTNHQCLGKQTGLGL